ncbi:MAG: potassium channel family protein [Desulfobacterales bacterium]
MCIFLSIIGIFIVLAVLWDGFETMVLPRRITRRFRFARLFYRTTWRLWSLLLKIIPSDKGRTTYRALFGPMSLLLLLCTWAVSLVVGFSLLYLSSESMLGAPGGHLGFGEALYMSGTTFFTLGLGDVIPAGSLARALTVIEAGMGYGFLAVLIGHLPSLNQSFSSREVNISLLDARAGSPPTAFEILYRHSHDYGMEALRQLLYDWERWSAELLESHLSFPVLAYYRSQHDNQSWLSALTAVLDVSTLVITGIEGACEHQAQLTFAMARHAVVDLAFIFKTPPRTPERDRLSNDDLLYLRNALAAENVNLLSGEDVNEKLRELRRMYEPYVYALSQYLYLALPPWISDADRGDDWQRSAWDRVRGIQRGEGLLGVKKDHF